MVMTSLSAAVIDADGLAAELGAQPATHAPSMGLISKVSYTHRDMIDFMITHPGYRLADLALRYGYSVSWISNISASDAFKAALAARRAEVTDPIVFQSVSEQFEGVTRQALIRLGEELEKPAVHPNVILRAVELGARAMGVGGNAAPAQAPVGVDHLAHLANRLLDLQSKVRQSVTIDQPASAGG